MRIVAIGLSIGSLLIFGFFGLVGWAFTGDVIIPFVVGSYFLCFMLLEIVATRWRIAHVMNLLLSLMMLSGVFLIKEFILSWTPLHIPLLIIASTLGAYSLNAARTPWQR